MTQYSAGLTRKIHDKIKSIKQNNDGVTIGGFVILALDLIVYDDKKVQKILDVITNEELENCGPIRLTDRNY